VERVRVLVIPGYDHRDSLLFCERRSGPFP
jgi:hypothetical protein